MSLTNRDACLLEQEKWEWIMAPASICCPSRRRLERARSRWETVHEKNTEKADPSVVSDSIGAGKKRKDSNTRRSRNYDHFLVNLIIINTLNCIYYLLPFFSVTGIYASLRCCLINSSFFFCRIN